jgi:NADPH:quinone reductase-like Zn-dependent oxidoreductase
MTHGGFETPQLPAGLGYGEGAEVVYDAVGGAQLATLGSVTKRHGHLILYRFKGQFSICESF